MNKSDIKQEKQISYYWKHCKWCAKKKPGICKRHGKLFKVKMTTEQYYTWEQREAYKNAEVEKERERIKKILVREGLI